MTTADPVRVIADLFAAEGAREYLGEPVTQAYLDEGKWEVDIAGKLYPAIASLKPLYDAENARIKM